ncbi:MAG TPA: tetratricopeptide repeat protein [Pirellulales bacterium]|nr:tetratricopeptide repeat protein [Pirellulales bacterium]
MLLLMLVGVQGCAPFVRRSRLDYRTMKADPNHDTERAKTENQRAIKLIEKQKLERAEDALQQALIADVNYGPAHNNLGKLYFEQGKFYLAAWEFEYANRLMPSRPECQSNLGLVYEAAGKLDEAIDCYSLAYEVDPKNPDFIGNLARAKFCRGDRDPQLVDLLNELQIYDSRADWTSWAAEQLALGRAMPRVAPAAVNLVPRPPEPLLRPPHDAAGPQYPATDERPASEELPTPRRPFDLRVGPNVQDARENSAKP